MRYPLAATFLAVALVLVWMPSALTRVERPPAPPAEPQALTPEQAAFFEKKIRPVLVEHCYSCHSADAAAKKKLKGGLLLDSREGLLTGGDSGKVVVPGKPADSYLIQTLKYA